MSASFLVLYHANISYMDFLGFYATEKTKNVADSTKNTSKVAWKPPKPIPIKVPWASEPNRTGYKQVLHGPKKWNMAYYNTRFSSFSKSRASVSRSFSGQKNDNSVTHYKNRKNKK